VEWNWQGETEVLGKKPVPVPLCPPQIPHGLTRDRTRASVMGCRRLTAWAMARRHSELLMEYLTRQEVCAERKTSGFFAPTSNKGALVNMNDNRCSDNNNSNYRSIIRSNRGKQKISGYLAMITIVTRGNSEDVRRGAPQQMLRTHRSLEAYCATLWWRWLVISV
jgi:hypothetical protein